MDIIRINDDSRSLLGNGTWRFSRVIRETEGVGTVV